MNWVDSVMAVPTIGIRINTDFRIISEFQKILTYFIDGLAKEFKELQIKTEEVWGYTIESKKGFSFSLTQKNLITSYKYALIHESKPGKLPLVKSPELMSYSDIMKQLLKYKKEILNLLKDLEGIKTKRIGIVATMNLDSNSVPPGLKTWIEYLGKPWNHELHEVNVNLWTTLNNRDDYLERCNHLIEFEKEQVDRAGYKFAMDWQRLYSEDQDLKLKKATTDLNDCIKTAVNYFEKFGEGDLNYD